MPRRLKRFATILLSACWLSACALSPSAPTALDIPDFPLLSPASFGGSARVEQVLKLAYGDRESSLQSFIEITPQQVSVLGVTALGQRIFTLKFDGKTLQADEGMDARGRATHGAVAERTALAPEQVPAGRILADLQLAFWPLAALTAASAGTDWVITEPAPGVRRLRHGTRLVAETHTPASAPWPQRLWLSNFAYGYSLDISSQPGE